MEISPDLVSLWRHQGYSHIHFGAVRLCLTLHGRKGIAATARVALLNTSYTKYQEALIRTVLTSLSAGTVIPTIAPDFNVRLDDLTLPGLLKVQIQIDGAEQEASAMTTTLHHQMIYRLQDHVVDLNLPNSSRNVLMVIAARDDVLAIIKIPKNIPKANLLKIMPLTWLTNYEEHAASRPVHTTKTPEFFPLKDGTEKTIFKHPDENEKMSGKDFSKTCGNPFQLWNPTLYNDLTFAM